MTTISVIIPAFNQGHYLGEAIQSALEQTHTDLEVAVIDDGSTDHTREVVRIFSDPRLCYIYQENQGLSAARNTGIRSTSGPLVTFLDSDDRFLPEKLALLGKVMDGQPEIGMAVGQAILIDQNGRKLWRRTSASLPTDLSELLLGNPLHVGSVLLRRTWLDKVGLFDENLRACEDWDLWLRLGRGGCRIASIDRPVSFYRVHTGQMTREPDRMRNAARTVLDKVFSSPDLPTQWCGLYDQAYSRYYLVSAAHLYRVGDFAQAIVEMKEALRLHPGLLENDAQFVAERIVIWATDPRVTDPIRFMEDIYNHLPEDLAILQGRRRQELGRLAMQTAYEAYGRRDLRGARRAVWQAFQNQPAWLKNRGALSIFFRTLIHSTK